MVQTPTYPRKGFSLGGIMGRLKLSDERAMRKINFREQNRLRMKKQREESHFAVDLFELRAHVKAFLDAPPPGPFPQELEEWYKKARELLDKGAK
jgi:hypothetical protein